jgi:hypothetical protein
MAGVDGAAIRGGRAGQDKTPVAKVVAEVRRPECTGNEVLGLQSTADHFGCVRTRYEQDRLVVGRMLLRECFGGHRHHFL